MMFRRVILSMKFMAA